jgi:3-hydroxybutyrate dehydrogenase
LPRIAGRFCTTVPGVELAGKTALVTGGGRGIGRAIAVRLAAQGARVVVTGRTAAEIDEVARVVGGLAMPCDMADRASIASLVERLGGEVGRIDVLVANAGVAESAPYHATSDEAWDRMMAINATAPFLLTRALVPAMIAARWGRVVVIASNAGRVGYAYTSGYCASKHAAVGLVRALALETARSGVTVNAICPGWVATQMVDEAVQRIAAKTGRSPAQALDDLRAMSPQRRLVEPEEVAHLVGILCMDASRGVHGQAIPLDGGQVMA